jgi:hypothetical protein
MATRPSHVFPWNDQLTVDGTSMSGETNSDVLQYDKGYIEERPNSLIGGNESVTLGLEVTQEESVHVRKWIKMVQRSNNRFNFYLPEDPGGFMRARIESYQMSPAGPVRRSFSIKCQVVFENPQF